MRKNNKKGFTIVELVIVIAVIAILAGVLIPTFSGIINKAKVSKDIQTIRNYNTNLKIKEATDGKFTSMYEVIEYCKEIGISIDTYKPAVSSNRLLWDSVNNIFCYLNDGTITYVSESGNDQNANCNFWVAVNDVNPDCEYSQYLVSNTLTGSVTVKKAGFDAGTNTQLTEVIVNNNTTNTITVRTNGGNIKIYAPQADVYVSGTSNTLTVLEAAPSSVHIYNAVVKKLVMEDSDGHVEVESGATIMRLEAKAGDIDINAGSTISYLEVSGTTEVKVEETSSIVKYYADNTTNVTGISSDKKMETAKQEEVAECTTHTEKTIETSGNRCVICSVCNTIISVERISGGNVVSKDSSGDNTGGNNDNPGGNNDNPGGNNDNPGGNNDNPGGNNDNPGGNNDNPGGNNDNPGGNNDNQGYITFTDLSKFDADLSVKEGALTGSSDENSPKVYKLADSGNILTYTSPINIPYNRGNMIIDLNGKTIRYNPTKVDTDRSYKEINTFLTISGKNVTIQNGTIVSEYNGISIVLGGNGSIPAKVTLNCNVIANAVISSPYNTATTSYGDISTLNKEMFAVSVSYYGEVTFTGGSYKVNTATNHTFSIANVENVSGCFALIIGGNDGQHGECCVAKINGGTFTGNIAIECENYSYYNNKVLTSLSVDGGIFTDCTIYVGIESGSNWSNTYNVFTVIGTNNNNKYGNANGPSKYTLSGSNGSYTVTEITDN